MCVATAVRNGFLEEGVGTGASVGSLVMRQVEAFLHPRLPIHSLSEHYSFLCALDSHGLA